MRYTAGVSLAAALVLAGAVWAQQVSIAGWVDRVDPATASITIRTLAAPRTIEVAPNAIIEINGRVGRLEQLPFNSRVSIVAEKDANGVIHATRITVQAAGRQPSAAAPPGAIVRGALTGINVPGNSITVRTPSGDYPVPLGTASIYVNGTLGSNRDLRLGQQVEVDRAHPTPASTDYVTQSVRVLAAGRSTTTDGTSSSAAAGAYTSRGRTRASMGAPASSSTGHLTGAGTVDQGYVRTRARAYKGTYRAQRSYTRHSARRSRARMRHRRIIRRAHRVTTPRGM